MIINFTIDQIDEIKIRIDTVEENIVNFVLDAKEKPNVIREIKYLGERNIKLWKYILENVDEDNTIELDTESIERLIKMGVINVNR